MSNVERIITIAASIITIVSFFASIYKTQIEIKIGAPWLENLPVSARFILFVVIDSVLNLGFGNLMQFMTKSNGILFFVLVVTLSFCCAWVTIFNLAIVLRIRNGGVFIALVIIFGIVQISTNGISIADHISRDAIVPFVIFQIFTFIVVTIVFLFDDTFKFELDDIYRFVGKM